MSPDWSAKEAPVPYAKLDDPQSLDLYGYVGNNPLSRADADGHAWPLTLVAPIVIDLGEIGAAFSNPVGWAALGALAYVPAMKAFPGTDLHQGCLACAVGGPTYAQRQAEAAKGTKAPPNPHGSKGAPDHQATADEEAAKMGENTGREVRIPTLGGAKPIRVADAATVENGKVTAVTQVIRPKKNGAPPKREVEAAKEIKDATGVEPKLVPVRPLPQ